MHENLVTSGQPSFDELALIANAGFKVETISPMKLDAYYVSMLSEKYKTGKINYFKAFLTGLQSNLKAKSANDYSSTVYVFKNIK